MNGYTEPPRWKTPQELASIKPQRCGGTLGDRVGEYLINLHCWRCGHSATVDPLDLAEIYGEALLLERMRLRATCKECGYRAPHLTVSPGCGKPPPDGPRQRRVAVTQSATV